MKKNSSLVEAFTDVNKQMCKSRPAVEPGDIYLAYCTLALCTIADKMTDTKPEDRLCGECIGCLWEGNESDFYPCSVCCNSYKNRYERKDEEVL